MTVTLSESSSDFSAGDITTTNATVANFAGSGTSYTFDLVPSGQGIVTADVAAGAFHDAANNSNVASNTLSRVYDTVNPTIVLLSAEPDPTSATAISVTVTLNEPSSDFDASDIGPTNASVSNFAGSGTSYSFDLVPSGPGVTVTAGVAAGAFHDSATNPNIVSNTFSALSTRWGRRSR